MASIFLFSPLGFILLLSFFFHISSSAEFWNIDCGASGGFTSDINLTWVGDREYVLTGESHEVQKGSTISTSRRTLRSFPKGRKNCYTIPVGANRKIRVKVDFFYGNYDGLASPPSFRVIFDGSHICSVQTQADTRFYQYCSWMYVTSSSNISICLGRKENDYDPIVNAIQVVALDEGMYPHLNSSFSLFESRNVFFSSNATNIRHPNDAYDRIWSSSDPSVEGFNYTVLNNLAKFVNTSSCTDNPPQKMFIMAATPRGREINLTIAAPYLASNRVPIFFNLYFSEVSNLTGTKHERSFHVYVDDNPVTSPSDPVVPPSNNVLEISGAAAASSISKFTLVPTVNSTLPPIISGLEVLKIDSIVSNGTYSQDVDGLLVLQNKFESLRNWTGDPCRPADYNWEWVTCSDVEPPRVTTLSLGGYDLSGRLPDFSNLDALETIDLHNNSLYGSIPDFLGQLPNLRKLNLANNNFSSIPLTLSGNKKISLNITGNPLLVTQLAKSPEGQTMPPPRNGSNKTSTPAIILYILVLLCAAMA